MSLLTVLPGWYGVDFSTAHPDLGLLRRQGNRFVVRYVRRPFTHPKVLRAGETLEIHAADLGAVVVFELDQLRPLQGGDAGRLDGATALEFARLRNIPLQVPQMTAADFDVLTRSVGARPENATVVADYLDGFASEVHPYPWGVYGDYEAITLADQLGSVLNWQMGARYASQSRIHPLAHVLQAPELWPIDYNGPHSTKEVDSNLCLRPFVCWGPDTAESKPPPRAIPPADYQPEREAYVPASLLQMIRDARYSIVLLVGQGTPEWLTPERYAALIAAGVPLVVSAAHPSFDVLANRAGISNLSDFRVG